MNIAVIPARGGSKRIPGKNSKLFLGKPIIAYSIEAALLSGLFDQVIVSTDDQSIADIANSYGALTPFIRPPELADDYCVIADVLKHAIDWYSDRSFTIDNVCCIYATAPLISVDDIQAGFKVLQQQECNVVMAVTSFSFPIQRAVRIDESGYLAMFNPEHALTRSQDLEPAYHDAAHFFWGTRSAFASEETQQSKAFIVSRSRVQDIDTPEDWAVAEGLYLAHNMQKSGLHHE